MTRRTFQMKACAVKLAVLASLFLFPAAAHAQTTSGSIYGTETWDASMNPIMVTGDITVEDGATLTIGHGCDIRFQQNSDDTHWGWDLLRSEIIVYGTLHIDGSYSGTCTGPPSPGESVLLIDEGTDFVEELVGPGTLVMNVADGSKGIVTNISTTTNPHDTIEIAGGMSGGATNLNESGDGYLVVVPVTLTSTGTGSNGWFGIIFSDGSATGTISYCNIDHSVYGINFTACAPAPSQPVVANCNINDVSFGIYFDDSSSPTIIDTSIIQAQIAFDCWAASSPTITNCNAAELTGEGVAVYATEWTTPSFTGCAFSSGSVKLDYYADLYIQDTTISDAGNAVIGYEFLAVGQAVIPSYTRIEMNNCNIIGLGDIGNGIEWDDNLDICKVEYSRIGGFQRNVFPRWGSEEPDAGIFHAVGLRFGGTDPNNVDLGDRGDPDPYRYWPPGYTDYSDGENEFYGVQDPDCLFNIGLEQSDILPPSLYQLEVWAENNWWVSTIDSVLSRYIWDHSDVQELGAVHYIPHRIPDKKRTYSVSGQILDNIGDPVEGVRVWVDISAQFPGHTVLADITGDDGYYIIYGLLPSATAYSIVPEKLFYTFSPSSITVTIDPVNPSDSTGHDFDATLPPPRVLSVSRADGLDGGAFGLPGRTNWGKQSETTPVVVTGLNLRETPSIFLQGPLPTTTVSSCSNVQWVTSTKVTATVPAGLATGDYSFWVVNPDGQDTLWGDAASPGFTIVPPPPPHVNSINPNPINDSYMGYLTVTGEDFQSGCNLTIDGYTWSSLTPSGEGTLLVVYHAPGTLPSGTWPVTVTNPGGQTSNDDVTLTVNGAPPPVVDSIDPDHGPNNRVVSVTIHGSDFVEMPRVLIGATECLNETFIDTTRLTAQIPTGIAPGTYDVTVVNPDGQPGVLSDGYTVDEAALNVLGVSPPMGRESGETEIILVGENFKSSPGPTVSVGSTGCANVRVISQTCLIATVPSGLTADLYGVTVDNNDGQAAVTLSDAFTVIGTPIITGVTITSGGGDTNKTTSITIDGSRFAYIPVVEIESSPPTRCTDVRFISSAELRANVPSGIAPGTYHVRVTNPLDQSDILSGIYTVRAAPGEPELLGVTPSSGRNNTETAITITGSNFSTPALVWVGSTECTDVVVQPGATEITATVPAGIPVGSHDLIVGSGLYAGTMTHGFTVGGSGTLNADTTFSRNAYLTGDIVVPDGITLTIEPGVLLTFQALRDDTSGGWDTERGEVRVYGRVNILGQDEGRITVTSDGAARSDWLGIVLSDTTASAWIEYALFTNAVYGLSFESNLNTPAANNPRPWVRNVNIASCSTGIALNSSIAFTCPAIDTCSIDGVQTGIIAAGTAAPIFTTTLFRNVSATGFNGKENAIVTMQNSSIVDAPKAIWCPQALTGEKINASILNLIFSVIGNGAIDLSDSASLTARMVTHLLFPDIEEIGVGMLFDGATYLNWDYSNIVQGAPDGKGLDWRSAGACSISNTVFANWGVGLIRQGRCGEVNLGDGLRDGNPGRNEFLGIMNPLATFNVHNSCSGDVSARYNWWLTTDYSVIDNYLYDEDDDPALGNIDYSDFLTGPRTYSVSGRIADTMEQGVDRVQVVASYSADRICTGGGADRLEDDTVDFYGIGAYVGITVGNLTDGSSGTVTDILTTTNPNDTLEIAGGMSGGASNDPGDGYHFPRTYNDRIGMTDNDGYYTVYGLVPGGYTIEPGKQDYTFTPATLDVTVTDTDINGQDFTGRLPLPVVTNVNREDGADGAAYGLAGRTNWGLTYETTDIVVAGINFRATPTIYLMRNPTPSASDQACANVEWIDSTRLTATVSAQLDPGDYYVRVVNPDGQYDVWNDFPGFTIVPPPAPSVYGIAPNPIQYDYEGTLAITGNNFLFYGGYGPTVTIRTQTWEYPSPTVWGDKNNLYIRYDVGMLPVGTYPVSVTNPDGQGSNDDVTLEVTVADPPVVTGIEPNPMEIDYAGYLTIHGQGFIDGCSVTIDGQTWSGLYVWGGGTILRVNHNYGMLPPGTHPVIVTNPDEQVSNDDVTLTVNPAPPPVVAGIDPDPININYSGNLTVTGRDFIVGCRLTIDGRTWSSLVPQINGTILEVYHASGILSPGTHSVVVTNPDGQTSNTDVTLTVAGPTPTPTSPPPTPPPTHTPTNTPLPTPTPTPRPLLNLLVSPAEPELFKPLSIHLSVEVGPELPSRFDAWGIIYPPRGGQLFFKGAPPCSLSPVPAPMVSNVSLSSDYSGTLFAVPSVPLGAEGTYIVRVGFVNPGVIPSGPDDFIPRYGDEKAVKISMP